MVLLDELVSFLGLAKNYMDDQKIYNLIQEIQNKLFVVGTNLATEDQTKVKYHIREEDIKLLEDHIDKYMGGRLNNPTGFIVPGSGKKSGYLHVCRTICRRAERRAITLETHSKIDPLVIKYLNRLSDLIYALARYLEEGEVKVQFRA